MIADRLQEDLIATFRFLDDAGVAITGLFWNTVGVDIAYKKYGNYEWTPIVPVAGLLGVYIANSFVADSGADGLYELGIPNISRTAGHRTLWRFRFAANQYRYDSIDYVTIPSEETNGVTLTFAIPGVEESFTTESEIYVRELERQVTFQANQDISAIPLVLVFEDAAGVDKFVITDDQMDKSAGDSVVITLPDGFTAEEQSLSWGIRHAITERVYGTGTINVTYAPFVG